MADESDIHEPLGFSLGALTPLALVQAGSTALKGAAARSSGSVCANLKLREHREPLRFCNSYTTAQSTGDPDSGLSPSGISLLAAYDVGALFSLIDEYKFGPLHVASTSIELKLRRGANEAYISGASVPRRVRAGRSMRVRLRVREVNGPSALSVFGCACRVIFVRGAIG